MYLCEKGKYLRILYFQIKHARLAVCPHDDRNENMFILWAIYRVTLLELIRHRLGSGVPTGWWL